MKNNNPLFKYYRVFKHDTAVSEVSTNNFKPVPQTLFKRGFPVYDLTAEHKAVHQSCSYHLPKDEEMFYGYTSQALALRKAKQGALAHINQMIREVTQGIQKLKDYRSSHHRDLNDTLLESNIRKLEKEMYIK